MYKQLLLVPIISTLTIMANNLSNIKNALHYHAEILTNFPVIETERLLIRNMTLNDIDDIFALTSDREIIELTPIFELSETKEDAVRYIETRIKNYAKGQTDYRAIIYKETSRVIGIITLDLESRYRADIGYAIAHEYWSQGIATEAAKAVIN